MNDLDPTGRFADRVEAYRSARPGYPAALFDHLDERVGGLAGRRVADLGSGTGILTAELLERSCRVWAVEPNEAMRRAAEQELAGRDGFHSVAGSAEDTGLEPASVELATAAQAFHWFDLEATRRELQRILVPGGTVAVIWNDRRRQGAFLEAYEAFLLEWATDYRAVRETYGVAERLGAFFAAGTLERAVFANQQELDLDGLRARLSSSSYLPGRDHPRAAPMLAAARRLFASHESQGVVRIEYDCTLYLGEL
ncbi:MAG TPA: methyltransferase domain-containing protein [Thermoanaerobaculia bacterium]|nr:methyltransferase domain-containing protein [Thermoanaerobaculia bacterium]